MDTIVTVKTEDNTSVQSISISSKILESHQYLTDVESIYPQIKINIASKYEATDVTELKKLFDFVAQNTNVEWAFSSIILNDGTKQYLLTTSHLKNKERSISMWINEKQPQKWLEHIHNHPMGNGPSSVDISSAKEHPNTTFYIYRYNRETDSWDCIPYEEPRLVMD